MSPMNDLAVLFLSHGDQIYWTCCPACSVQRRWCKRSFSQHASLSVQHSWGVALEMDSLVQRNLFISWNLSWAVKRLCGKHTLSGATAWPKTNALMKPASISEVLDGHNHPEYIYHNFYTHILYMYIKQDSNDPKKCLILFSDKLSRFLEKISKCGCKSNTFLEQLCFFYQ